ncbi:MAG: hypothetical protein RLZZ600_1312 [Actinomycetota bacterium]
MMRIDPSLSLVWRTPDTVQIGFPTSVVTAKLTPAQEHLLVALRAGSNTLALYGLGATLGLTRDECDAFAAVLKPAFTNDRPPARLRVAVDGHGPSAEAILRLLGTFCDARFANAAGIKHERMSVDRRISRTARARAEKASEVNPEWRPDFAVLVDTYAVTNARCGVWLRRDIPHLSVVLGDTVSRVGPLVRPDTGPCLSCVEMNALDADSSRAAMLAQLHGKPCGGETALVSTELATVVARVIQASRGDGLGLAAGEVLELDATTGLWTSESTSTCSRCSCRVLPGSEKPAAA